MAHQCHNFPLGVELRLKDAGAVASSAAGTVGGQAAVVEQLEARIAALEAGR